MLTRRSLRPHVPAGCVYLALSHGQYDRVKALADRIDREKLLLGERRPSFRRYAELGRPLDCRFSWKHFLYDDGTPDLSGWMTNRMYFGGRDGRALVLPKEWALRFARELGENYA